MFALAALLAAGCSEAPAGPDPVDGVASVQVSAPTTSLSVGATLQLSSSALNASGRPVPGQTVEWSSSRPELATISGSGLATGLAAGTVRFTARTGGRSGDLDVEVEVVPVGSIHLDAQAVVLRLGSSRRVEAAVQDTTGKPITGRALQWASSEPGTVSVDSAGTLRALAAGGPVIITASMDERIAVLSAAVPEPVASVAITPDTVYLHQGAAVQLGAAAYDAAGNLLAGYPVEWSSVSSGVAAVDATGRVTGNSAGTTTIRATADGATGESALVVLSDGATAARIAGSIHLACGITVAGKLYCWGGENMYGTGEDYAQVDFAKAYLPALTFRAIDGNSRTICALTVAGDAYCMGENSDGQLGVGHAERVNGVHRVLGGQKFVSISVGGGYVCALTDAGKAFCWGNNSYGQFGNGTRVSSYEPVPVADGHVFTQISADGEHACGLTDAGKAYCWGWNNSGELGDSTRVPHAEPMPVHGDRTFTSIHTGGVTAYAVTPEGDVYVWGNQHDLFPTRFPLEFPVRALSVGTHHVLAQTEAGDIYGWGQNGSGEVGDGTYTTRGLPVRSASGHEFDYILAAEKSSYALTPAGEMFAWGSNEVNKLGTGGNSVHPTPQPAAEPSYRVEMPAGATVEAGRTVNVVVTLSPMDGGFTTRGPKKFLGDVSLSVVTSAGVVSATLSTTTVPGGAGTVRLTLFTTSSTPPGEYYVIVSASAPGARTQQAGVVLQVTPPPTSGTKDLRCPTGETVLESGYHCMTNSAGQHVPGRYSYPDMHGTWVDTVGGVCINWGSNGQATVSYKNGGLSGPPTTEGPGEWGVIVRSSGEPEAANDYPSRWYVFTEHGGAQLSLLSYDSASKMIMGWGFQKGACPW